MQEAYEQVKARRSDRSNSTRVSLPTAARTSSWLEPRMRSARPFLNLMRQKNLVNTRPQYEFCGFTSSAGGSIGRLNPTFAR